jgi:ketosteroid isomerase-like protein
VASDEETMRLLAHADQEIDHAVSRGDAAALDALFAADYVYNHSHGRVQGKEDYLATVAGRPDPPVRTLSETIVEVHDDLAISSGNLDVVYPDGRPTLYMRYSRLWRRAGGTWTVVSHRTFYAHDRAPNAARD